MVLAVQTVQIKYLTNIQALCKLYSKKTRNKDRANRIWNSVWL